MKPWATIPDRYNGIECLYLHELTKTYLRPGDCITFSLAGADEIVRDEGLNKGLGPDWLCIILQSAGKDQYFEVGIVHPSRNVWTLHDDTQGYYLKPEWIATVYDIPVFAEQLPLDLKKNIPHHKCPVCGFPGDNLIFNFYCTNKKCNNYRE